MSHTPGDPDRIARPTQICNRNRAGGNAEPETLEDVLAALQRYGCPWLHVCHHKSIFADKGTDYWHCKVNMNVTSVGSSFEVEAETFKHETPIAAARDCLARIREAFRKMKDPEAT